ncbi:glycoside hydrolase family 3 C-terminal domain-containing protein [Pseudarthrobacter scleromae]|uniref:glycoside hydrolase family 3 C-terminal domain-containing protein n=1 Tax=Pseudarthrobacter scleromae TaxID=158897 RepID=UPI003D041FF5
MMEATPAHIAVARHTAGEFTEPSSPEDIMLRLSEQEKATLVVGQNATETHGVDRLGVRPLRMVDGPHGVRRLVDPSQGFLAEAHPATCFPTAAALGATWNVRLLEEIGHALGREAAALDVDVLLGPGANLKRTPIGGRNFEYFSEDPLLSSSLSAGWIRGVQAEGVGASMKHFAANNTEQRRYGIDVLVDDRALRELYLASFERAIIDARPATVMAAYNKLNGIHCTENSWLLHGVLRNEWGYKGAVISDWGAAFDGIASLEGGTDLAMPGPLNAGPIEDAVQRGDISHERLNAAAGRVLALGGYLPAVKVTLNSDSVAHHALARRAAAEGTVLLKNDGGLLPLSGQGTIAVIGAFAAEPRYQGGGSSQVNPTRLENLLDTMRQALGDQHVTYAPGYDRTLVDSPSTLHLEAVVTAESADVAIVVIGLPEAFESEGTDRVHMELPAAHNQLVTAVVAANPNTVVVLMNGSPVEMPWRDRVPSIVEAYLGGQAGGSALADVLLGAAEPGGRLAESFPERYADHPVSRLPAGPAQTEYWESIYVGYRYFDSAGLDVAFPFGHGLSYTVFDWSSLGPGASTFDETAETPVTVTLRLTNVGARRGSEVVQVYVRDVQASVFRPRQELAAFAKVELGPGEHEDVTLRLERRAFSFWDTERAAWVLEPGEFEILVGSSSREAKFSQVVTVKGQPEASARDAAPAPYLNPGVGTPFTRQDFEVLYGSPLPLNEVPNPFGMDTALRDMKHTVGGGLIFRLMRKAVARTLGLTKDDPLSAIADDVVGQINFRMMPTLTEGAIDPKRATQLLRWLNWVNRLTGWRFRRPPRQ